MKAEAEKGTVAGAKPPAPRAALQHLVYRKSRRRVKSAPMKPPCTIEDCDRQQIAKGLCMTHYQRQRRTGSVADPVRMEAPTTNGYPIVRGKRASEYIHRQVLWEKIGLGPHPCYYCGRPLNWQLRKRDQPWPEDFLTVDHLDHDKTNNDPSNLVPCCHRCNAGKHPKGCQCITHRCR